MHTPATTDKSENAVDTQSDESTPLRVQTVEQLEENINLAATEIGESRYQLRKGMFRIHLNLEQGEVARMFGGPTVQIYLGVSPFNRAEFKTVLLDCLKNVAKLWHPVLVSRNSYVRVMQENVKKWKHDPEYFEPSYRLADNRIKVSTNYVTTVKLTDKITGISVQVTGDKESEWALKEQAIIMLSRRVAEFTVETYKEEPE